jgi:catechol 2,3-dioxygenase-like lactoylglutathione lyase family enzyme
MTTQIQGLDFILLPTQDKARAIAFYRDALGLELDSEWGEIGAEFKLDGAITLAVADPTVANRPFVPLTAGAIAIKVADVPAAVEALKAKGVEFVSEIIDSGVCKMAYFSDPDGNSLMLHCRYAD